MANAKNTGREWTGNTGDEAFHAGGQHFGGNTLIDRLVDQNGVQTKAEIATGNGGVITVDIEGTDVASTIDTTVEVMNVALNASSGEVTVAGTLQLTATVSPSTATNKAVTWESSDEDVATVSAAGLVTGVAEGIAVITVTTTDQGKTDTAEIMVTA